MKLNIRLCAVMIAPLALLFPQFANAAEQNRTYLIERFQDGDIPTGQDVADMIDSALNLVDDGLVSYRIGVEGSTGHALRLNAGEVVGPSLSYVPVAANPPLAPLFAGQFGFLPLEFRDSSSNTHYGYLQLQMASGPIPPPSGAPGPAIFVEYLVWETTANVPLTTFTHVPEPTSAALLCSAAIGALSLRRRLSQPHNQPKHQRNQRRGD
jgi:hypothetical protein